MEFKQLEESFRTTAVIWHLHVADQVIRTTNEHLFYVWGKAGHVPWPESMYS